MDDSEPLVPWHEISALSIDRAEALEDENERLRAEIEQLKSEQTQYPFNVAVSARVERDQALAEVERLNQRAKGHDYQLETERRMGVRQQEMIERLRAALARFGNHLMTCRFFADLDKAACDCGFTAWQT